MLVSQSAAAFALVCAVTLHGASPPRLVHLLPALGAGAGGTLALGAFYRALTIGTMSIVAPISASGAAVPVVVGIAGGDRPAVIQLVGIAAAITGVVLASRETGPDDTKPVGKRSIPLALIAALGFGGFFVGMRASARFDVLWALTSARVVGVVMLVALAAVRRDLLVAAGQTDDAPAPSRRRYLLPLLAAIGLLDLLANVLFAIASRHGLLSIVSVAASLYPLMTVLLARAVLGERVRRIQELGIAAALAGVVLIAAG